MHLSDGADESVRAAVGDLVLANRMLTVESALDAYGHVSVRHPTRPERFLMSQDSAPALVTREQVSEYTLDGELATSGQAHSYLERYIHAAIYAARPDVKAVCHNHAPAVLPFCACPTVKLDIISHTASVLEDSPPIWDISDEFGPCTNVMVSDIARGNAMARTLGIGTAVLLRSHGSTVVGRDVRQMVVRTYELIRNARTLLEIIHMGKTFVGLRGSEIANSAEMAARGTYERQWNYLVWRAAQLHA